MDILRRINSLVTLLLLAWFGMALYQAGRALPDQLSLSLPWRPAQNLQWLSDQTWQTASGERLSRQQIFDQVLEIIDQARRLVVLDMFLFNEFAGQHGYRPLSSELAGALIRARENHPDLEVVLITDPSNTLYGGVRNPHLEALQAAGITVVMTPLERLPASNPLWTGLWALCCQFLGKIGRASCRERVGIAAGAVAVMSEM